jgi:hypothetical protein
MSTGLGTGTGSGPGPGPGSGSGLSQRCNNPPDTRGCTGTDTGAKNACKQIQKDSDSMANSLQTALSSISPMSSIINALGSHSSSQQDIRNTIITKLQSLSNTEQESQCNNLGQQSQTNDIEGMDPACLIALAAGGVSQSDLNQYKSKISNVVQKNSARAVNNCKIDLLLKALTDMDASVDNSTIQTALNKAKGVMSSSTSSQDICNDIETDMTTCKYLKQTQCCSNIIQQTQSNLINSKCTNEISNIVQSNSANFQNSCILDAQTSVSDKLSSKIKNTVQQSADNESEGLTLNFILIILAIVCAIISIPILFGGFITKNVFLYLGPLLLIVSLVFFILFFVKRKNEITVYNQAYVGCQGTKILSRTFSKSTFGNVKKRVQQTDVLGYDFFIDIPEGRNAADINPRTIRDDQMGSAIYITGLPSSSATCTYDDPTDPKTSTVTYIKAQINYTYLALAIGFLLPGVFLLVYGLFKKSPEEQKKLLDAKTNQPLKTISKPPLKTIPKPPLKTTPKPNLTTSIAKTILKPSGTKEGIQLSEIKKPIST